MNTPPDDLQDVFDGTFADIGQVRETFAPQLALRESGTITSIATGIAKVAGLPGVGFEEVLKFAGDLYGIAFNVDENEIGVVLLGDYSQLQAGDDVELRDRPLVAQVHPHHVGLQREAVGDLAMRRCISR